MDINLDAFNSALSLERERQQTRAEHHELKFLMAEERRRERRRAQPTTPTRQPVEMRAERRTNTVPLPLALFGGAMALPLLMPIAGGLITIAIAGVALVLFGWPLIALIVAPFRRR